MSMKRGHLINKINRLMPNAKATTEAEFYGDESYTGIWLRGSENYHNELPIFCMWNYEDQVHPELIAILDDAQWTWEPYDAGTLMLYPN